MNALTSKAAQALTTLHRDGWRGQVNRQMIDRLNADKLIDFELDRGGWFVTSAGLAALQFTVAGVYPLS
jgi:phage-related tail fiber protein